MFLTIGLIAVVAVGALYARHTAHSELEGDICAVLHNEQAVLGGEERTYSDQEIANLLTSYRASRNQLRETRCQIPWLKPSAKRVSNALARMVREDKIGARKSVFESYEGYRYYLKTA